MVEIQMEEEAEKLKEAGNQKLKENDYSGAVADFTNAIELNKTNHIFYSNRCASLMYLQRYDDALADAEMCTKLAPTWGKGWARKGAALQAMNRLAEAEEAFKKAKELGHNVTVPSPAGKSAVRRMFTLITESALFVARLFMIACVFIYALDKSYFKYCLSVAIGVHLVQLYMSHGMPRFTQEYGRAVMFSFRLHYIVICIIFLLGNPMLVALLPIVLAEIGYVAEYIDEKFRVVPSLVSPLDKMADTLMPLFVGVTDYQWKEMPTNEKWSNFIEGMTNLCASFEVVVAFVLLFDLITPNRNFLVTVLYFQFLRVRYITSFEVKTVFNRIDTKFRFTLSGIPLLSPAYNLMSSTIERFASLPKPGEKRPMERCTIM